MNEILNYITEKSEKKIGRYTPGTHIEIFPDSRLIKDQPDYALILAHNWEKQIKNALKDYKGGWIIPNAKGLENLYRRTQRFGRVGGCARATA